jgi:glutathione S-transferase
MYKLYNVKRWGSMSAHFVLEELGVPYQNIWMTPEQVKAPEFRDISPLGYIPVLGLLDGRTVIESSAIVTFLTDAHPERELAPPAGSGDHAIYLSALAFMAVNLYPAINLEFGAEALTDTPEQAEIVKAKAAAHEARLFDIIDHRLAKDGPHLAGERFTAADIYLFMLTVWAHPSERALLDRCPNIARIADSVRARPQLKAALEAHGVFEPGAPA